jgi:hypothetical protein
MWALEGGRIRNGSCVENDDITPHPLTDVPSVLES